MKNEIKLFMVILGCRPAGRNVEQHDIFFGIAKTLKELLPQMNEFWPDSGGLHIDSWREISQVGKFSISVKERSANTKSEHQLFFINLGGYKENDLEEYHYKVLVVAKEKAEAIKESKGTAFFKHTSSGDKGGNSHIDDKYGIDVDDVYKIEDILHRSLKKKFSIKIMKNEDGVPDKLHIGYVPFSKIK